MVIKLVRVDSTDTNKITLSIGTHQFGRGKLLNVEDKRVSRKHGELQVKADKLIMKALHQNPCFYRKDKSDVQVLKCDSEVDLSNGDRFGLLPDSHWFEIINYPDNEQTDNDNEAASEQENTEYYDATMDGTVCNEQPDSPVLDLQQVNCANEMENPERVESNIESKENDTSVQKSPARTQNDSGTEQVNCGNEMEILERTEGNIESDTHEHETSLQKSPAPQSPTRKDSETDTEPKSPQKRSHSPEGDNAKRIKVEPADVKQEADDVKPGPSDNGNASGNDGMPPSPQKVQNNLRERCYYGARCYRRNPMHLAQFSHPKDPDWGTGDKGECPFGAACCKRDQKHWDTHNHPPGVCPPVNQGGRKKIRKRRSSSSESDGNAQNLIVTGKRKRKTVQRNVPSYSETESETDPWASDGTDDWEPESDDI